MIVQNIKDLQSWREAVDLAIDAQAHDKTLWDPQTVQEAYILQSLRWLHMVIEDHDVEALKNIVNQSTGNI